MTETQLRKECLQRRKNLTDRKQREEIIFSKVISCVKKNAPQCIGIYVSYRDEVDTIALIQEFLKLGIRVCVPKMKTEGEMDFVSIASFSDLQPEPKYGILEPIQGDIVLPTDIDLMFVPGSAFDPEGRRMGYGKGYYDRYLIKTKCRKVGLCFSVQLVDSLALFIKPTDILLDEVISDEN